MQTKLAAIGLIAAAGGGTWLATSPPAGDYYAMAPHEVASRLATAQMPGEVGASMSNAGQLDRRVYKRGDDEVVWEFSVARTPLATFTAALEPDGEGTRVAVDFAISDSSVGEAIAKDMGEGREFLTGVLELAMAEHVDATLEKRAFDEDQFGKELAKYALSHPVAARKFMRQAQTGGPEATKAHLRERIEADAEWHSDVAPTDTEGFDPTPDESDW